MDFSGAAQPDTKAAASRGAASKANRAATGPKVRTGATGATGNFGATARIVATGRIGVSGRTGASDGRSSTATSATSGAFKAKSSQRPRMSSNWTVATTPG